jgi:hypothetical protein
MKLDKHVLYLNVLTIIIKKINKLSYSTLKKLFWKKKNMKQGTFV